MSLWSDDRVDKLISLWQEGLSASEVACALGCVTRNAVIGKVHRLGLAGRAGPSRGRRHHQPIASKARAVTTNEPAIAAVTEDPYLYEDGSLVTLRTIDARMCHWPIGDPASTAFHFCGRASQSGSPYCEAHTQRAHQPHRVAKVQRKRPLMRSKILWG